MKMYVVYQAPWAQRPMRLQVDNGLIQFRCGSVYFTSDKTNYQIDMSWVVGIMQDMPTGCNSKYTRY